jgi:hypothetical protein
MSRQAKARDASDSDKERAETLWVITGGLCRALGLPLAAWLDGYADQLPSWGYKVIEKLKKTVFRKSLDETGPVTNPWHRLRRIIGLQCRFQSFAKHEAEQVLAEDGVDANDYGNFLAKAFMHEPNAVKTLAKNARPRRTRASKDVLGPMQDAATLMMSNQSQQIKEGTALAMAQKAEDTAAFIKGLQIGSVMLLDESGQFSGGRERTEFYLDLLAYWPEIEKMRRRRPPLSRKDLFAYFQERVRSIKVRDEGWFNDVCDEIGLTMKHRGRPTKNTNSRKLPVS